jgi:hypothetical protein
MRNSPAAKQPGYIKKRLLSAIAHPKGILPPSLVGKIPKRGEIRNPAGKPPGTRSIKAILEDLLSERYIDDPGTCNEAKKQLMDRFGLKAEQMTNKDVLFRQLFDDARKGDTFCRQFLADRTEGPVKQILGFDEHTNITVTFTEPPKATPPSPSETQTAPDQKGEEV